MSRELHEGQVGFFEIVPPHTFFIQSISFCESICNCDDASSAVDVASLLLSS